MKVYIMTDLEGPSGVNGRADAIGNRIVNESAAGKLLTEEVNACVEGLVRAGADEIVVWDGHGGSNSIDITMLHPAASLGTIGSPILRTNLLDASYDAAVQLGAHALQGTENAYMNHTFSSHSIAGMRLNGKPIGEIGVQALLAAYFRVPTILVSGDRAACAEARNFIGKKLETVVTKNAVSRYTVINRNPVSVREELAKTSEKALKKIHAIPVPEMSDSFELEYRFMCPNFADDFEKRGAERLDCQTVILRSKDFMDLYAQMHGWAPGLHNRKYGITRDYVEKK